MPDANGNLIGGPNHGIIDPLLGPLADNGGPTLTHSLLAGSPAINAGDLNAKPGIGGVPVYDQRGEPFARVFNGRIDIGAFEHQQPSDLNLLVDTLEDESDHNYARGDFPLREAIELANQYGSIDTIRFDASLTEAGLATILLTQGELAITDDVTIEGPGAEWLTVSGNNASRVFHVDPGTAVTVSGQTITGGGVADHGGGILNEGKLSVSNVALYGNSAAEGGGIYNSGTLEVTNSTLTGNSASDSGGICNVGTMEVTNSTVSGNSAEWNCGGIGNVGTMEVTGSTISGNSTNWAGGIGNQGMLVVTNSTISGNTAFWGGGVVNDYFYGTMEVTNSIVAGNTLTDGVTPSDLTGGGDIVASSYHNLFGPGGSGGLVNGVNGNIVVTAMADLHLGPLADNGGPTWSHALFPGSPAIDAGDPSVAFDPNEFDQRGAPFARVDVLGGQRIDIGAYELHPPAALAGDYNLNGVVDAADYVIWRKTLGGSVIPYTSADGDGDCAIDDADYGIWRADFGNIYQTGAGAIATRAAHWSNSIQTPAGSSQAVAAQTFNDTAQRLASMIHIPNAPKNPTGPQHANFSGPRNVAPVNAAFHDDGLIAWLASCSITDRHDEMATRVPLLYSDNDQPKTAEEFDPILELAFASFAELDGIRATIAHGTV
jgi:hypothetical protein